MQVSEIHEDREPNESILWRAPKKWRHADDPERDCDIDGVTFPATTGMDVHQLEYWADRTQIALSQTRAFRQSAMLSLVSVVFALAVATPVASDVSQLPYFGVAPFAVSVVAVLLFYVRPGASADSALDKRWIVYREALMRIRRGP